VNESDRRSRLVALAVLGFVLVNYPLLALFDLDARVLGVPVLWAYLLVAWATLIALVALIIRRPG
jgi:hypothetical protein